MSQTPDAIDVEDTNTRKKLRQENYDRNNHTEPTLKEQALIKEVNRLHQELEKAQREKDILMTVVHRLTQGPG